MNLLEVLRTLLAIEEPRVIIDATQMWLKQHLEWETVIWQLRMTHHGRQFSSVTLMNAEHCCYLEEAAAQDMGLPVSMVGTSTTLPLYFTIDRTMDFHQQQNALEDATLVELGMLASGARHAYQTQRLFHEITTRLPAITKLRVFWFQGRSGEYMRGIQAVARRHGKEHRYPLSDADHAWIDTLLTTLGVEPRLNADNRLECVYIRPDVLHDLPNTAASA